LVHFSRPLSGIPHLVIHVIFACKHLSWPPLRRVDSTVVGNVLLAALVHVHTASFALEPLSDEPIDERSAVIAEGGPIVRAYGEAAVRHVHALVCHCRRVIRRAVLDPRTLGGDALVAALVHHDLALLALVALLAQAPNEIPAM